MVKICNRDDCENQRESHNITIPVKKGLFPKNDNGVITNNNDTSECDPNSVTWAPEKLRRGTVSVQLLNSKQVQYIGYFMI